MYHRLDRRTPAKTDRVFGQNRLLACTRPIKRKGEAGLFPAEIEHFLAGEAVGGDRRQGNDVVIRRLEKTCRDPDAIAGQRKI